MWLTSSKVHFFLIRGQLVRAGMVVLGRQCSVTTVVSRSLAETIWRPSSYLLSYVTEIALGLSGSF